jgi:hypothetical protein
MSLIVMARSLIPPFTVAGLLPPGDYALSLEELSRSMLVSGPKPRKAYPHWDTTWRSELVQNLGILVQELWQTGITEIFVDGPFVEDKDHPNDIDGYFECEMEQMVHGELEHVLNLLNEHKVWTWEWDRRWREHGDSKPQLPMWHFYRVELYPHYGQPSGIVDEHGYELEFPSAFRWSRRGRQPRGIVKIRR